MSKVEPPDWWIGHSWNPVRVLIQGRNLAARASMLPAQVSRSVRRRCRRNGNYVFVDLTHRHASAKPGRRAADPDHGRRCDDGPVRTVAAPLRAKGRFQGFSPTT